MKEATAPDPADDWAVPEGVVVATVCPGTWQLATSDCPNPRREVFTRQSAPTRYDITPRGDGNADGGGSTALPLHVSSPADGAILRPPFIIEGVTSPGAMVTIEIVAEGVGGGARAAEAAMQAASDGRFAYEFRPSWYQSGTHYVIMVSAVGLNGAKASRRIAVSGEPPRREPGPGR
jgi:hypothetical protein